MGLKHYSGGWENSERMSEIMTLAYDVCGSTCDKSRKTLMKTVEEIILYFEPDFFDTSFQSKPCNRKLKYLGEEKNDFFIKGEVYESIDFTGATYSIKGYDGRIGCIYFERVT